MAEKAVSKNHEERLKRYEEARNRDIVSVAESLGMDLGGRGNDLFWKQHDSFKFNRKKNYFYWNSRRRGGGPIELVQLMKNCKRKEAVNYLLDSEYKIGEAVEYKEEPKNFTYFLKDHTNMALTRDYLINRRQLSEETVDFFISKGLLSQATFKGPLDEKTEPVMVFKSRDSENKITSVSLRGLWKQSKHPGNGYLRRVLGDGFTGMVQSVGNPPEGTEISKERPLKIIAFEAPIDLMSYYEMYQHEIGDALLLAMDGFKKGTISKLLANQLKLTIPENDKVNYIDLLSKNMKQNDLIQLVLAVDNDSAGKDFIDKFQDVPFSVVNHFPPLPAGTIKSDWNDVLVRKKANPEKKQEQEGTSIMVEDNNNISKPLMEQLTPPAIEKKNQEIVGKVKDSLEDTFKEIEKTEPATHYLTGEEVQQLLDTHLTKIEQLLAKHIAEVEKVEEPTLERAVEITDTLSNGLEFQAASFSEQIKLALVMKKNDIQYNVKEYVDDLRLLVKNGFNNRILRINESIKKFAKKIEQKFAIEEKIVREHPNEKYSNPPNQSKLSEITGTMDYETLVSRLANLTTEQKNYVKETLNLQGIAEDIERVKVIIDQKNSSLSDGEIQKNQPQEPDKSAIERKLEKLKSDYVDQEKVLSTVDQSLTPAKKEECNALLQTNPTTQALGRLYEKYYEVSEIEVIVAMNQNACDRNQAIDILATRYFTRNNSSIIKNLLIDLPKFQEKILHVSKAKTASSDVKEKKETGKQSQPKNKFEERLEKAKRDQAVTSSEKRENAVAYHEYDSSKIKMT